ncbi:MAG: LysM peptidoglycan-binding domain-containing protein [Pseudomonadota bacterium]|nr:LysM peptidoglycan-binding domain-containing protein [Pseudomonadota bacterium]
MNKIMVVALLGGFLVVGAISLTLFIDPKLNFPVPKFIEETRDYINKTAPDVVGDSGALKKRESSAGTSHADPENSSEKKPDDSDQIDQIAPKPSFDIVRVNPSGDLVVAGRGSPNGQITVYAGQKLIGSVKVDGRGEWVLIPEVPLSPGSRELRLQLETEQGLRISGDRKIIVYLPDRAKSVSSEKSEDKDGVLALSVPQKGGGTEVLQRPRALSGQKTFMYKELREQRGAAASEAKSGAVSIDAVDYDPSGETTINGSSEPRAKLNVYLNNKLVAKGNANSEGKWRIITGESFSGSQSEVRVDLVDEQNKVLKRAKMNFISSSEPLELEPQVSVKVARGSSLWRIARRQYGKGVLYSVIFDANRDQIENPDLIYPGQVFLVPLKDRN